jgi:type VI secretion system protein ImpG
LYPKPSEPIRLDHRAPEYKVVADANQDNVVEVYSVEKVTSMTPNGGEPRVYAPLYSLQHVAGGGNLFWYASRKPRIDSCKSRRAGDQPPAAGARTDAARNARPATDVLLSFVDLAMREQQPDEKAVLAHVLCTNGDVAQHLKGSEMRQVKGEAKASFIGAPSGASAPPDRSSGQWRLISHLALNSLSMVESGKEALQEILRLYDPGQPPDQRKDIGAIIALRRCRRMARMASDEGVSFCPGISVEIDFDERLFDGGSPYLMAAVLNRFLGLYSAVNSFTQLTAYTMGRTRPLKIWPARKGEQVIL